MDPGFGPGLATLLNEYHDTTTRTFRQGTGLIHTVIVICRIAGKLFGSSGGGWNYRMIWSATREDN